MNLGRQYLEIFLLPLCLFESDLKRVILCGICKMPGGLKAVAQLFSRLLVMIAEKRWEAALAWAVIHAAIPHDDAASPGLCQRDRSRSRIRVLFPNAVQQRWPLQVSRYVTVLIIAPPWLSGFSALVEADFFRLFHINMTMPIFKWQRLRCLRLRKPQSRRLPDNTPSTLLASLKILTHW